MTERKFLCPQCQNPIEEFYIPPEHNLSDDPGQPVCRCPHCDAFVDDQVQAILDRIIEEETLREWIWQERLRIIRSINTVDELLEYWKTTPAPPEDYG